MSVFSCVGLIGRLDSESTAYSLKRLIAYLRKQNIEILLDEETAAVFDDAPQEIVSREELGNRCGLIIVVGGDGSLLSAARAFAGKPIKILGINRGRLGFLTDISPHEIEYRVGDVLNGKFISETRFLLESNIVRDGQCIYSGIALNDVVLHPGQFIRMIEFELFINEEFVYRQRSDGLIISSPTGSTAYALSCGGPIMHPSLDAIVLVPMNPHVLNSRPLLVPGNSSIRLRVSVDNNLAPQITNDGQVHAATKGGDDIIITKSEKSIELIHPTAHNFYETCRGKLGWASEHTGNK